MDNVIEGNKIIAEFMGFEIADGNDAVYHKGNLFMWNENDEIVIDKADDLKYHSDWNELMPVWIKAMLWYRNEFGLMTSTFDFNNVGLQIKANDKSAFRYTDLFTRGIKEDQIKEAIWLSMVDFSKFYISTEK